LGLDELANTHLDHIVPDALGGPGAYWNFLVCCGTCNDAKRNRTPWQWFQEDHRAGWDAYAARVRARTFQLKPKKVRILTQPDAPDLVQRYQSLAETAWIARLAQTLVCLQFGWPRNFSDGPRRVVVLPGGLTARVRRKYKLNSLLGQDIAALEAKLSEGGDAKTEFEIDKKCRADKRHHALDAMVLSFLPQWTADPTKAVRVKLPDREGVHREFFEHYLTHVVPTNLCFEKPTLEESAYGRRLVKQAGAMVATKRFELKDLGLTGINPVFKSETLKKDAARILDPVVKTEVGEFIKTHEPDGAAWLAFCDSFRQPGRVDGPRVKRVRLIVAEKLDEFNDVSKGDRRPALKRGDRHRGYFLYSDMQGKVRVRPVYVFQSPPAVRTALLTAQGTQVTKIIDFFRSGCAVTLAQPVEHPKTPLQPGVYKLNSIWASGFIRMTSAQGVVSEPISAQKLVEAGFAKMLPL
jgi:CRISPR-associated endonuclease Csn1